MYNLETFEQLIKSELSDEEVSKKILELNPIKTKVKYCNDEEEPFGVYVGGLGKDDLLTINDMIYPLTMRFDTTDIYTDFVKYVRKNLQNTDKTFPEYLISCIKKFPKYWFSETTEDQKDNIELAKAYMEYYKTPGKQRDGYAGDKRIATFDEEKGRVIYDISKFKGVYELAKCTEINSVVCNLLSFVGYEAVLVQGRFIKANGKTEAHTFPIYKNENGNYNILDCILRQSKKDFLPEDVNFEEGFNITCNRRIIDKDGVEKVIEIKYVSAGEKLVKKNTNSEK